MKKKRAKHPWRSARYRLEENCGNGKVVLRISCIRHGWVTFDYMSPSEALKLAARITKAARAVRKFLRNG